MRKVTYACAVSLDFHLARADGGIDWLLGSPEIEELLAAYWKTVDTVLMGRKTYEFTLSMSGEQDAGMSGVSTYVFSRALEPGPRQGATIVGTDAAAFTRTLKEQPGKDIWLMGGGGLARTLLEAGLVDEVSFNVHPVLLGSGIPALHPVSRQVELELVECRSLPLGCALLTYRVRHGDTSA